MDKYITFDPWWGGMNNVRMSYELAAAMSVVTNRKLVLPPKVYVLFFAQHQDKESYFDFWKIWDKKAFTSTFDCVDYEDVPELQKYNTESQYFDMICKDYPCITFGDHWSNHGPQDWMGQYLLHGEVTDDPFFTKFQNTIRPTINLNRQEKIIHFPSSLFGYWYFHIYNEPHHNLKEKIKQGVKVRPEFEGMAKKLMPKDFDAVHIRRGDFLQVRKPASEFLYDNLLQSLEGKVRKDKPLFIATDEKDKSIFNFLKDTYDITFLSDLVDSKSYTALVLDMVVCSNAENFFGSKFSTFTDYIHILRHYKNKRDTSRHGLNYNLPNIEYRDLPWLEEPYAWDNLWVHLY